MFAENNQWDTIKWTSKNDKPVSQKTYQRTQDQKRLHEMEDPEYVPKNVSYKLSQQIKEARIAKKMTQQALATAINRQLNIVKGYENGTEIPNTQMHVLPVA